MIREKISVCFCSKITYVEQVLKFEELIRSRTAGPPASPSIKTGNRNSFAKESRENSSTSLVCCSFPGCSRKIPSGIIYGIQLFSVVVKRSQTESVWCFKRWFPNSFSENYLRSFGKRSKNMSFLPVSRN